VSIAAAQIAVARVLPDPVLTVGVASVDVSGKGSPTATTVGLGYTVELGGKRSARIAAAEAEHATAALELADFFRTLSATAANGFIDGLAARLVLDRKRQTFSNLEKLVAINQERLRAGDSGKVALTQSRVEAERFRGEVLRAEADLSAAELSLAVIAGGPGARPIEPQGDLRIKPRVFDVEALAAHAKENRPDLAAKQRASENAAARVELAQANRWVDVTLNVGWQHSFASYTPAFAQPAFEALTATVSVPLPLSRVHRGELDAALATQAQRRSALGAAGLRAEIEVRQAFVRYQAAVATRSLYTGGLLADTDQVLEATLYNYQRGGATLLEVLEAQRTQNDVYLAYGDALAEHARALVALEQAAGIWDIDL
jgi:cobalt-zinc-cadmium efflux system outer membrane protein